MKSTYPSTALQQLSQRLRQAEETRRHVARVAAEVLDRMLTDYEVLRTKAELARADADDKMAEIEALIAWGNSPMTQNLVGKNIAPRKRKA